MQFVDQPHMFVARPTNQLVEKLIGVQAETTREGAGGGARRRSWSTLPSSSTRPELEEQRTVIRFPVEKVRRMPEIAHRLYMARCFALRSSVARCWRLAAAARTSRCRRRPMRASSSTSRSPIHDAARHGLLQHARAAAARRGRTSTARRPRWAIPASRRASMRATARQLTCSRHGVPDLHRYVEASRGRSAAPTGTPSWSCLHRRDLHAYDLGSAIGVCNHGAERQVRAALHGPDGNNVYHCAANCASTTVAAPAACTARARPAKSLAGC